MSRVPRIRFKGFEEDWEQRKLISCLSLLKDGTHGTHKDYPSGPLLLSAKNIKNGRVYYDETDRRISYKDFEKIHRNFKLQIGDILLTIVGSIGETALLKDSFEITFQRSVAFLRANDNILPEFLMSEFNTDRFRNELENRKSTSAQPGIYLGDLGEIPVFVSKNPAEQRRVGSYFESLDHLITLHQRKLEKLKIIKKSMLENLFPQNGEKTPKIRFSGFTKDWEQRKLGEVFEEYSEKNHSELPPLTIIQGGGTIRRDESDRALQYDMNSLSNYKMVNKDDFIVHLRSFEGGLEKANSKGIISPAYHTFSGENTDATFYYTYFRSEKFIESDLKPHVYGIRDGRSIDVEGMKSINIPYTIFEEQRHIGYLIDSINHLITLHQSKLEKLQKIKKSMLESMFV
ncbi:restriction endonuclease subunit S [Lachnoanaerobaculum sp.]